jgi:Cu-Zn family superoxide dismutase
MTTTCRALPLRLAAAAALTACHAGRMTRAPTERVVLMPLVVERPAATAAMRSASGTLLGTLAFAPTSSGVRISGTLTGLPPGTHGIHFHQVVRCDPPDFTSAGSHFNPAGAQHGLENPQGPHAGDLPNITADAAGRASVDLRSPRVTLDSTPPHGLFDADGTALVIHAAADDQRTDPSGNSGARIACGVITRS